MQAGWSERTIPCRLVALQRPSWKKLYLVKRGSSKHRLWTVASLSFPKLVIMRIFRPYGRNYESANLDSNNQHFYNLPPFYLLKFENHCPRLLCVFSL